jgi:hypothetical protein
MPQASPTRNGGGKPRKRLSKMERALRRIDRLQGGIVGPTGRDPFSPNPNSTRENFPADPSEFSMFPKNPGADLMRDWFAKAKRNNNKADLAKNLPPIQKPKNSPPGIMTPGSGIAGAGRRSGGGVRAGKMPNIDTDLDVDDKGIFKRAKNAAAMEYNPQIAAIRNMLQSTQREGKDDIKDTGQAYAALQASIQGQLPGVNKVYDDAQAQQQALYAKLTGDIDARYGATQDRNAAEFERLGIQAATPSTGAALTSDRDFLSGIAGLQGAGIQGALELQQQGAAGTTRSNATRAGFEGANQQREMRETLAEKILALRTQKGSLVGNKARARRELTDQYHQEAIAQAERDRAFGLDAAQFRESVFQDRRNFRQGQEEAQAGFALDAAKLQQDAQEQSAADFKSLDPQERAAAKADQLVPGSGARMFAYLQNLIRSDKNIRRGFYLKQTPDGKTIQVKITPEQFGYLAAKQAKLTGLPKGSVQKIATAYWMER